MKQLLNACRLLLLVTLAAASAGPAAAGPTRAAQAGLTLTVEIGAVDLVDTDPGDGVCRTALNGGACTLRAAVMEANAYPGPDQIILPAGLYYVVKPASSHEDAALDGDFDLTDDVTIVGAGETATIINGNRQNTHARVFQVHAGVTAMLANLAITNGVNEPGPGITGGLLNQGDLTLDHVILTANENGGLENKGTAALTFVTYAGNFSYSAALGNFEGGVITIANSLIANNINPGHGGGIVSVQGSLTLINSVVRGNQAVGLSDGGGLTIMNSSATIINSTISGNWAGYQGGGIYVTSFGEGESATLNLYNVTLANNIADFDGVYHGTGGGLFVHDGETYVTATNSLLANNRRKFIFSTPDDCAGAFISGGYNLVRTTTGCSFLGDVASNVTGQDPLLTTLADHGGVTWTHALEAGSPAIAAGNPAGCADHQGAPLTTDQRGFWRFTGGRCDIGAYEYESAPPQRLFLPSIGR